MNQDEELNFGERLVKFFWTLLFARGRYSQADLARLIPCPVQTIPRLVEAINGALGMLVDKDEENGRVFYSINRTERLPNPCRLKEQEMFALQMCRAFSEHLFGQQQSHQAKTAELKGQGLLPDYQLISSGYLGTFRLGRLGVFPPPDAIPRLIKAIKEKLVCRINYQTIMADEPKDLTVKPLKLFAHHDTVYLHSLLAGKLPKDADPLDHYRTLATHRIKEVIITDQGFGIPKDYDFDQHFNQGFGIIKKEPFRVEVEFWGWSARFVRERVWGANQVVRDLAEDKIKLSFEASSKEETISWIFFFGEEAKVLRPDWLVAEVAQRIGMMQGNYGA